MLILLARFQRWKCELVQLSAMAAKISACHKAHVRSINESSGLGVHSLNQAWAMWHSNFTVNRSHSWALYPDVRPSHSSCNMDPDKNEVWNSGPLDSAILESHLQFGSWLVKGKLPRTATQISASHAVGFDSTDHRPALREGHTSGVRYPTIWKWQRSVAQWGAAVYNNVYYVYLSA